jgi:hypothetical protein
MISDGTIVNGDINAAAAIEWTKIAPSSIVSSTELGYLDGVTSAIQTQLNDKAPLASPTFTGTVGGITKSMVGLGSVDNTADTAKPVSTAQQTALDLKANLTSPTLVTPVLGVATATSINGTTIPSTKTLVVTTDKLSALSATTSAELAGVISDETGSGALVFATSPTLVTPSLCVATGTSFNSITGLSSTTPIVDGTAAVGTGTTAARGDHVHPTPTSVLATVTGTNSADLVYGNMADNDQFRIRVGGTATNAGFVEIATADDGTEPIYVRQYTGVFTTLARTATLLDGSGNTYFPGNLSIGTTSSAQELTINSANTSTNSLLEIKQGDVTQAYVGMGTDNVLRIESSSRPTGVAAGGANHIFFNTNSTERFRIASDGAATTSFTTTTDKAVRNTYMSTSSPSGGADGDVWIKYTA